MGILVQNMVLGILGLPLAGPALMLLIALLFPLSPSTPFILTCLVKFVSSGLEFVKLKMVALSGPSSCQPPPPQVK